MDVKILLGKRIRELRRKHKMTQQELAELIDIDQRNLSNLEQGINFSIKTISKLTKVFNITFKELFDFENIEPDKEMMQNFIKNSLNSLTSRDLALLYSMTKFMIS